MTHQPSRQQVEQLRATIADGLDSAGQHIAARQVRAAATFRDYADAYDYVKTLACAVADHGLFERLDEYAGHILSLTSAARAYHLDASTGPDTPEQGTDRAGHPLPCSCNAGVDPGEAWDEMVSGYLTTPRVSTVVDSASDRPFVDWLRLQHTRTDSTGAASKCLRSMPSSWDLQLMSIFEVQDAFDVHGGPGWALDDAVEEYRAELASRQMHQSGAAGRPSHAEPEEVRS